MTHVITSKTYLCGESHVNVDSLAMQQQCFITLQSCHLNLR